jgi:hypothetical protein
MPRWRGVVPILLALALMAGFATAQDREPLTPRYWTSREITFPVPVDRLMAEQPRPTKLRFFVGQDGAPMRAVSERTLQDLDDVPGGKKGFRFSSPSDGEYDFALQVVFADSEPQTPTAQYRVIFDTRPPSVRAAPLGTNGIEWVASDENADPAGLHLEARWAGTAEWKTIRPQSFKMRDRYTWRGLTASQPLEVRVVVKDKAGHEMASPGITLPTNSAGAGVGSELFSPTGRPGGDGSSLPNRPQITYINTNALTITSKLSKVTRSGVAKAYLWVDDGKTGWKRDKESPPLNITQDTPEPTIKFDYDAKPKGDGLYGFIVIPVNGAGGKPEDPRPGDQAQFLIEVDTEEPFVKVGKWNVTPSASGERVEIQYEVKDKNLMADSITIEYADSPTGPNWTLIGSGLPNSGRHTWQVDDKTPWKFYVRVSAVDKASNRGFNVGSEAIVVDLDRPSARIESVERSGLNSGEMPRRAPQPGPMNPRERPGTLPASPGPPRLDEQGTRTPPAVPTLPADPKRPPGYENFK